MSGGRAEPTRAAAWPLREESQGRNVPKRDSSAGCRFTMLDTDRPAADGRDDGVRSDAKPACVALVPMVTAGAMVADPRPSAVPPNSTFVDPSDRNRRAGSADAQPAAGNARRCADAPTAPTSTGPTAPASGRGKSSEFARLAPCRRAGGEPSAGCSGGARTLRLSAAHRRSRDVGMHRRRFGMVHQHGFGDRSRGRDRWRRCRIRLDEAAAGGGSAV